MSTENKKKPGQKVDRKYDRQTYAVIAVDVAMFSIIDKKLHVLLMQTNKPELKGNWALPGGLIKPDEGLEDAVERVVKEKTGLTGLLYDQLETFGDPDRDPFGRVVSVGYLALIDANPVVLRTTEHYDNIGWVPITELPKLAYDHDLIARRAVERLRNKVHYTNIVQGILPDEFTLTELQTVYEIILGHELDKRNFRKKVIEAGLVQGTGKKETGKKNRPAELYRFSSNKVIFLPVLA